MPICMGEPDTRTQGPGARDVQAQLQYLADDPLYTNVKPLQWTPASLDGQHISNIRLVTGEPETIRDVRGTEHEFDLDQNGFRYVQAPTTFTDWSSNDKIGKFFIPEMEELLCRELDEYNKILVVDYSLRLNACENHCAFDTVTAKQVHNIRTEPTVVSLVRKNYGVKADHLLAGRVRLISMWRPINHTVSDCALAVIDGGKLDARQDVVEIDLHNPASGELCNTMGSAHYRRGYEWYYMSEQTEDDVLLFKSYDSDNDINATTCLRTEFELPSSGTRSNAVPCESIEVHVLVFTYPDERAPPSSPELRSFKSVHPNQWLQETTFLRTQLKTLQDEVDHNKDFLRAVLDLRHWESKKSTERLNHLLSDRDHSRAEAVALSSQLDLLEERITGLYIDYGDKQRGDMLMEQIKKLISTSPRLSKRVAEDMDASDSLKQAKRYHGPDAELLLLREQLEAQKAENRILKISMNARIEDKANTETFRAAVKEAVARERSNDQILFQTLHRENEDLRRNLYEKTPLKW